MSNNGAKPEEKLPLTCSNCQQVFSVPTPRAEIVNGLRTSAVTAIHEKLIRCPGCKKFLLLVIAGMGIQWGYQVATDAIIAEMGESTLFKASDIVGLPKL